MPANDAATDWVALPELTVSDAAAVEVLWHPAKRRHLGPFLGQSAGLADAALALDIQKTAMSYWIKKLVGVGLIRPCAPERRGGRRLPRYRCVADRLRVSLRDAPLASHEAVFDDVAAGWQPAARQALARSMARQAHALDLTIETSSTGGMATAVLPRGDDAPPDDFIYYWGRLWLSAAEREQLRQEFDALWTRWAERSDRGAKPHAVLVHMLAVPERPR